MSSATLIPLPDGHDAATRSRGDDAGPRRVERARGLRSFLTWSFFLAQIAAAERFIGGEADAAPAEEGAAKHAASEAKTGDALTLPQGVAAASDGIPGATGERAASASPSFAQNTAGGPNAPAQQIAVAETAPTSLPITIGGGAGSSGGGDAPDFASPGVNALLPGDSLVPGDLLPLHLDLNAPALLGNVTGVALNLVDGTLTSLGAAPVVEDLCSAAFSHELPAGDLASITGLLLWGDAPSAQLMGYASLGDAEASISAGAAAYPDLTLALADQQAVSIPAQSTPGGSWLHDLPIIGDALASTPGDGAGDHHADVSDLTSGLSQIADHVGLPKTSVDLWS